MENILITVLRPVTELEEISISCGTVDTSGYAASLATDPTAVSLPMS